jgi:chromate transporter
MDKADTASLQELAKLFLKLGTISFGGPAVHIAMMEDEVVQQRQWLTREQFLDLVGATNLIPGPNSTEMAIHIGYLYAGWRGLLVAGVCFILPATLITAGLAWLYVTYGSIPQLAPLLAGIKPVAIAIIFNALWRLGKKAIKTYKLLLIAVAVAIAVLALHLSEVVALLAGGLLGMFWLQRDTKEGSLPPHLHTYLLMGTTFGTLLKAAAVSGATVVSSAIAPVSLWELGWFALKVGSVLFGGGYVLIAFLQAGLVQEYGWLTQQQLLDAIAIGQFTPGPVSSTLTFVGYVIAGFPGAVVATAGIFLPAFGFVVLLNPMIPRLRSSRWMSQFLDAVNVSALSLMAVVTLQLGAQTFLLPDSPYLNFGQLAIALIAAVLAIRFQVSAVWLVLGAALVSWGLFAIGLS